MNLANRLTLLRVILVPVFVVFLAIDTFYFNILALIIFIIASITDYFDGLVARQQNTVTTFGIFLDPLADKLLVTSAFVSFIAIAELQIPAWMVITIIAREFIITGLRSLGASKNVIIPASIFGKVKTTSQITAIITILVILIVEGVLVKFFKLTQYDLFEMSNWQYYLGWILINLPYWLMFVVTILTLYSGINYIFQHKDIFRDSQK
ncbi:MAG: CDP-diacylglycerol--glycerol-3-phosphate 3-phosphatidyltransferase [Endomicrobiaceae bacterium]|nr:CDP-diacylglycerol--glycerol-3-phosphate 3-phosphatidyltransferase [Endomicrobiaceae bacterium]